MKTPTQQVVGGLWTSITKLGGGAHAQTSDLGSSVFMMFQVILTGGYDDTIEHLNQRALFGVAVIVGITLISILIGLITDSVNK